ncbi:aldose epimerase [Paenibacillus sp. GD4]|jgi:galactose mutarotase-like enzyme|uniref:aldose epimerase family protein n=1 Tax=Paenibacillus sp. GD4 TaxID=3068890 RepID=UPI002796A515|nr:aldose epimerase [Paenibacillus sp. GD4]MDQ1911774.1 aldose epimerase [Paenibacillus sp. GD4]
MSYQIVEHNNRFNEVELIDAATDSAVTVAPGRGGMAIRFRSHGKELFYLDEATYQDEQANVRGGNPVLFPISGQLQDGMYSWNGHTYKMSNHGLARTRSWKIIGTSTDGQASVTLSLSSDEETLKSYPFPFELRFTYSLKEGTLTLQQEYRNLSDAAMPMYPGFHPYFATDRKKLTYELTGATELYDYNDGQVKPFHGTVDLEGKPESVALLDSTRPEIRFAPSEDYAVRMSYDPQFRYVVLWAVEGKPFVCVEPWMAKTNELNVQKELVYVSPGETLTASLQIRAEA